MVNQKNLLDLQKLEGTPTLIVSSNLKSQIDFLHEKVRGKEWCGPLIYKVLSGDINDPDNLVIRGEGIYLMNIGTAGYTDFKMDEESTIDMFNQYPDLEEMKARTGFVHTHHSMGTGFSATDNEELAENTENYLSYVSLIVNYGGEYSARVAFITNTKQEINQTTLYKNINNESVQSESTYIKESKVVSYYDCDVSIERLINTSFIERYNKIQGRSEASPVSTIGYNNHNRNGYTGANPFTRNDNISTYANMRFFAAKMVEQNPNLQNRHLEQTLTKHKLFYGNNPDNMINVVDECLEAVLGTEKYKSLTITEKYEFFDNVNEMLNEDFPSRESHVNVYRGAEELSFFLTMLTETEDELTSI